jgi:hypothetical protein
LLEVWEGSGDLLEVWEGSGDLLEVWEGSRDLLEVQKDSGDLLEVSEGSGDLLEVWEGFGDLLEVREGFGDLVEVCEGSGDLLEVREGFGNFPKILDYFSKGFRPTNPRFHSANLTQNITSSIQVYFHPRHSEHRARAILINFLFSCLHFPDGPAPDFHSAPANQLPTTKHDMFVYVHQMNAS